nr:MAG TPA: hypothetical protein [Caudoviricetes sp.]
MIKIENNRVFSTEEGAKVRRLSDGLTGGMISAKPGQTVADFEEVSAEEVSRLNAEKAEAELQRRREDLYAHTVSRMVHERYSIDAEIALMANAQCPALLVDEDRAASVAAELEAYQAYRAECKKRAAAEVEALMAQEEEPDTANE